MNQMELEKKSIDMGQPIKLGQFIISLLGVLITVAVMIYGRGSEDARTSNRIDMIEKQFTEFKVDQKEQNDKTSDQIKEVDSKVNEILIILQNKQDRK